MEEMSTAPAQAARMDAYRQPTADVVASLGTDAHRGLTAGEAQARLARDGRNELTVVYVPVMQQAWRLAPLHGRGELGQRRRGIGCAGRPLQRPMTAGRGFPA